MANKLSWKKSLLSACQFLGQLLNTLAANEKYPVLNRDNLTIPIQMQLSQKSSIFSLFFAEFLKSSRTFERFGEKVTLRAFVFSKLQNPKTWLDKCLKSSFSENPSTIKMVNVSKHYSNLHNITFIIFIGNFQVNWVGKSHRYWHAESWDCLLKHWLTMENILFLIETV